MRANPGEFENAFGSKLSRRDLGRTHIVEVGFKQFACGFHMSSPQERQSPVLPRHREFRASKDAWSLVTRGYAVAEWRFSPYCGEDLCRGYNNCGFLTNACRANSRTLD